MTAVRNIALLIESSRAQGRRLLRGIGDYVREHGPWSIYYQERTLGDSAPAWFSKWRGDGIIARIESPRLAKQIVEMNLPTVDLRGRYHLQGVPSITTTPGAVERAAAEHLLDCGFKNFAYCGIGGLSFSEERRDVFTKYLEEKEVEVSFYESPPRPGKFDTSTIEAQAMLDLDKLMQWLHSLPKPVGIMACNDIRAQQVLNACRTNGIAVPEEVAIIGVDNDEVLCGLCNPSLSSIDENAQKVGYEAAALLDRMISGRQRTSDVLLTEPIRLVARQSTDILVIDDPNIREALRFIRQNAAKGIQVSDVLEHVMISHSTLKRHFSELLGRSPKDEITRIQLQCVKENLVSTDLPLWRIAEIAGFNNLECMCRLFKKKVGQTPGQYRTANHGRGYQRPS